MNAEKYILIRHGQTVWNREQRYQGRLNTPLTDLGQIQAQAVGHKVTELIDGETEIGCYCSPLGRAIQTAEFLRETCRIQLPEFVSDPRLQECNLGRWQGYRHDEIEGLYPGDFRARSLNKWNFRIPEGGESYGDLSERAQSWVKESIGNHAVFVIVAHEMINRALRGVLGKLPQDTVLAMHQKNDEIVVVENGCETLHRVEIDGS